MSARAAAAFLPVLLWSPLAAQVTPTLPRLATIGGPSPGDAFGAALASCADLNGDGVRDLLVGAPAAFGLGAAGPTGIAYVVSGNTAAPALGAAPLRILWSPVATANARLGAAVTAIGDLDNDGVPEFAVGAPGMDAVHVFSGATGAPLPWSPIVGATGTAFGEAVAALGDVDNDGKPDLAIGAPMEGFLNGAVRAFAGANGALLWGPVAGSAFLVRFSRSLAAVDDVNGDGARDLAALQSGAVRLLSGATGAEFTAPPFASPYGIPGWATAVAHAGDLGGDGLPEIVVATTSQVAGPTSVHVLSLPGGQHLPYSPLAVAPSGFATGSAPLAVIGDADGDGVRDFAVSVPWGPGAVHVFSGASGALLRLVAGGGANDFATALAGGADQNGDGFADFAIGRASATANVVYLETVRGAQTYGLPASPIAAQTLTLQWGPGGAGAVASGLVAAAGAGANAAGLLGASLAPAALPLAGITVWLDVTSPGFFAVPIAFDAAGTYAFPLDLGTPAVAGLVLYVQAAELASAAAGGVSSSPGLALKF